MELGLGTVSFGMKYGIANEAEVTDEQIVQCLDVAAISGVRVIDTAHLYGNAQVRLGKISSLSKFDAVSKLPSINELSEQQTHSVWQNTLSELQQEILYGCLLHQSNDLINSAAQQNYKKLMQLKDAGLVEKIGVSVYSPEELKSIINRFEVDLIQVPINVFDHRFIDSGVLKEAKQKGIEIHSRSCFLQGLLLMDEASIPPYFEPYKAHILNYFDSLKTRSFSKLAGALNFLHNVDEIDVVIVGCHSPEQLKQIISANDSAHRPIDRLNIMSFRHDDEGLILPINWSNS